MLFLYIIIMHMIYFFLNWKNRVWIRWKLWFRVMQKNYRYVDTLQYILKLIQSYLIYKVMDTTYGTGSLQRRYQNIAPWETAATIRHLKI